MSIRVKIKHLCFIACEKQKSEETTQIPQDPPEGTRWAQLYMVIWSHWNQADRRGGVLKNRTFIHWYCTVHVISPVCSWRLWFPFPPCHMHEICLQTKKDSNCVVLPEGSRQNLFLWTERKKSGFSGDQETSLSALKKPGYWKSTYFGSIVYRFEPYKEAAFWLF